MQHKMKFMILVALLAMFITACKVSNEKNEITFDSSSQETKKETENTTNPIVPYFQDDKLVTLYSTIKLLSYETRKDKEGNLGLLLLAEFTNQLEEERSPAFDWMYFNFSQKVEQEEVLLKDQAIISEEIANDNKYNHALGNMTSQVEPGKTVEFICFLKLKNTNPVKLTAKTIVDEYEVGEKTLVLD